MPSAADLALSRPPEAHPRRRLLLALGGLIIFMGVLLALYVEVLVPVIAGHQLLAVGSPAPAIRLRDVEGVTYSPLTADGPVVLDFFNTDCDDCVAEVPALCSLIRAHPGLNVVGIDVGAHGAAAVAGFLRTSGGGCLHIAVLEDSSGVAAAAYHLSETPTTYLVEGGRIRAAVAGNNSLSPVASGLSTDT